MFATRQSEPTLAATHDRFRGTAQRWTIEHGPLAGTSRDHTFNEDWSIDWRVSAGRDQGRIGRARVFQVQPLRTGLFMVAFQLAPGEVSTVAVDFTTHRFAGFETGRDHCHAVSGSIRVL